MLSLCLRALNRTGGTGCPDTWLSDRAAAIICFPAAGKPYFQQDTSKYCYNTACSFITTSQTCAISTVFAQKFYLTKEIHALHIPARPLLGRHSLISSSNHLKFSRRSIECLSSVLRQNSRPKFSLSPNE